MRESVVTIKLAVCFQQYNLNNEKHMRDNEVNIKTAVCF